MSAQDPFEQTKWSGYAFLLLGGALIVAALIFWSKGWFVVLLGVGLGIVFVSAGANYINQWQKKKAEHDKQVLLAQLSKKDKATTTNGSLTDGKERGKGQ